VPQMNFLTLRGQHARDGLFDGAFATARIRALSHIRRSRSILRASTVRSASYIALLIRLKRILALACFERIFISALLRA
jgi:hypothetical protein